ncbi:MAG: hypothetical protein NZ581_07400, partial [Candidatus Caldarchaeum sp.]|nr:hypothetical protein [Candidatus Caldarchaeum sp.]MDW8436001.1 hypothetical protein [Candidatus Caldarchaeum sp.]
KDSLDGVVDWVKSQLKPPIIHLTLTDREPDLNKIQQLVNLLRGSGCLEVRYRRVSSEPDESIEGLVGKGLPSFNIEELIKNSIQSTRLSPEAVDLALKVYRAFHSGGAEMLQNIVLNERPDRE